jgi:hypothetical protein
METFEPPEGEVGDPQATLVADEVIETLTSYLELVEDACALATPDGEEVQEDDERLAELRARASTLTASAAQVIKEARAGLSEHDHECPFSESYAQIVGLLTGIVEGGAGLLELHASDQVDRETLLRPALFTGMLFGAGLAEWLYDYCSPESEDELETLLALLELELEPPLPFIELAFGPLQPAESQALRFWLDVGQQPQRAPRIRALLPLLPELGDTDGIQMLQAPDGPGELALLRTSEIEFAELIPLLDKLIELKLPYRLELDELDVGERVEIWLPGLGAPLSRRVRTVSVGEDQGSVYQLETTEYARLLTAGANVTELGDYLILAFTPGDQVSRNKKARLKRLSELANAKLPADWMESWYASRGLGPNGEEL